MSEQKNAESVEGADTSKTSEQGAATLADLSPELQAELTKLVARKEKEWERKNKGTFDKASEFEKLQEQIKQQQEAELSEAEKLRRELEDTRPFKTKAERLESTLKTYLDQEIERIPEDMRSLIPNLPVEEQLAYISVNRDKLHATSPLPAGQARTTQQASGLPDPLREKANTMAEQLAAGKPPEYKKALADRLYASYKTEAEAQPA